MVTVSDPSSQSKSPAFSSTSRRQIKKNSSRNRSPATIKNHKKSTKPSSEVFFGGRSKERMFVTVNRPHQINQSKPSEQFLDGGLFFIITKMIFQRPPQKKVVKSQSSLSATSRRHIKRRRQFFVITPIHFPSGCRNIKLSRHQAFKPCAASRRPIEGASSCNR